eukprot:gene24501-30854_t
MASGVAFSLILNITGGIGGSLANFIIPGAVYIKLMPKNSDLYKPAIAIVCLGIYVMISVVTMTIISVVQRRKVEEEEEEEEEEERDSV